MKFKRPSLFSVLIFLCAILVVAIIIFIIVNSTSQKINENESEMSRIDSIEGDQNIVLDSDGNKVNSSKETLSQKNVDGFIFDSFEISFKSGVSTITFEIYNPENDDKNLGEYELKVLDEYDNVVGRVVDNAGIIEGLQRKEISLQLKGDISNLANIQINKIVYEEI